MRLKIITTALMLAGLGMLFAWPWVLHGRPGAKATQAIRNQFFIQFSLYTLVLMLCFAGTAFCAILLVRRAREEYRAESMQNMKILLESTLHSHKKTEEDAPES